MNSTSTLKPFSALETENDSEFHQFNDYHIQLTYGQIAPDEDNDRGWDLVKVYVNGLAMGRLQYMGNDRQYAMQQALIDTITKIVRH